MRISILKMRLADGMKSDKYLQKVINIERNKCLNILL